MLPRSRVHDIDMTVEEALKYVISMGVVAPKPAAEGRIATHTTGTAAVATALDHRN